MGKPRKSFALWILGHVLYALFALFIFAVCALVIWRVFIANRVPKDLRTLAPNAVLVEAYRQNGESLTVWTQEQSTITRAENNSGYFSVPQFAFIDEAGQLQVIFRYNNGALTYAQTEYGLAEKPSHGEKIFDLSITTVTDLTPDSQEDNQDGSDNLLSTRLAPTSCEISTTSLYTYYQLTFDTVSTDSDVIAIFLDIYYIGDTDYTKDSLGTLRLYHYESERLFESLSSKEKDALANYTN